MRNEVTTCELVDSGSFLDRLGHEPNTGSDCINTFHRLAVGSRPLGYYLAILNMRLAQTNQTQYKFALSVFER